MLYNNSGECISLIFFILEIFWHTINFIFKMDFCILRESVHSKCIAVTTGPWGLGQDWDEWHFSAETLTERRGRRDGGGKTVYMVKTKLTLVASAVNWHVVLWCEASAEGWNKTLLLTMSWCFIVISACWCQRMLLLKYHVSQLAAITGQAWLVWGCRNELHFIYLFFK